MIKAVILARKSDGFFLCEHSSPGNNDYKSIRSKIKTFLRSNESKENRNEFFSMEGGKYLHTCEKSGVLFAIICESNYPKKLSKAFGVELTKLFNGLLENEYGSSGVDHRSKIETIDEPYYFIKFATKRFEDVDSTENIDKINSDLYNIQNTMSESLQLLMDKDKSLRETQDKAKRIQDASKKYRKKATEVRLTLQLRKYMVFVVILIFLILFVYLKFM